MKKRIIGIDIDGVITDENGLYNRNIWHHYLCNYIGKELKRKENIYNIYEAYDLSKEVLDNFLKEKLKDIYIDLLPNEGVKEVLEDLKENDFTIVLITARDEKYREITETWLNKYGIVYDKLIHRVNKVPCAKNEDIQLFIEDDQNNAESFLNNGIGVILFDKKHNRDSKDIKNKYRVNNWQEAEELIYDFFDIEMVI
ncbi:MAG: 5' nucleotidase, NT5C type [Bacillota bacterium]